MKRAIRALAARPAFTAVAVATLAIGFSVNAAIFSLTRNVLLRPLPYPNADRLVIVGEANPSRGIGYSGSVPANYVIWRQRVTTIDQAAGWRFVYFTLTHVAEHPQRVQGVVAMPDFFPMLGVTPMLGRLFTPDEARPGRDRVVLLSYGFWRRQFGGDPQVVGRTLLVDGTPCAVVGVLPDAFKFFRVLNRELDVWKPFPIEPDDREHSMTVYARLKPTVSVEAAQAELAAVYAAMPSESFRDGWVPNIGALSERFSARQRPILEALQGAVALVLCIGVANIANLVLAVAAGRRKDVAVRIALGATRWRLATELGRETLLLASAGAVAGVLLAVWIVDVLNGAVSYQDINRIEPFRVDVGVVLFTIGLAMLTALLFAVLPARRAADADVIDALKESSDSSTGTSAGLHHRRLRSALVVAELALSIVLLTTAAELTRTAISLDLMERGVDADRVMTAQLSLNGPQYAGARQLAQFADAVLERLRSSAGIESASLVNYPPLSAIGTSFRIAVEGRADRAGQEPFALCWIVAPSYFATVGVPVLQGRDFTATDTVDSPGVAIVSRRLAERFWGDRDAIGRRLTVLFPQSGAFWIPKTAPRSLTVVGIAGDVGEEGIDESRAGDPQMYVPYAQNPTEILTLVARPEGPPASALTAMRDAVRAVDASQPTFDERTLEDVRRETLARPRELAWLIGVFATLALLLSALGVYAVIAQLTASRRREIGIRMALGATERHVVRLVVGDALRLGVWGAAVGLIATPAALTLAATRIGALDRSHPATVLAVSAALMLVSAAAAYIPARRAANITSRT